MKNILITGAAGNIGSSLAATLCKSEEYFVVAVDDLTTGSLHKISKLNLGGNFEFIKADVNDFTDISGVFYRYKFDYVFHFAAVVGVKRTLDNPIKVLNDIKGIENILKLSKNTGVKRVFYSSSSEVYGEPVTLPQNENTTPLNSRLPYAVVKNIGEAYFKSYKQEYNLDYTIFRFFNTYGPNQSDDFVVARFLHLALNNMDITIYGDGMQTRTFCYISDNVDTMVACLEKNLFVNDIINIGSDKEMTVLDLANLVIDITQSQSKIIHLSPLKEGDMTRRMPDNAKMKEVLQRELISVEDGIKMFMAHKQQNS
jgi:UDP-glucuronate decarboxylase